MSILQLLLPCSRPLAPHSLVPRPLSRLTVLPAILHLDSSRTLYKDATSVLSWRQTLPDACRIRRADVRFNFSLFV